MGLKKKLGQANKIFLEGTGSISQYYNNIYHSIRMLIVND